MASFRSLADYAVNLWTVAFAAFFLLSIIVGIIQHVRRKELHDTAELPALAILWAAFALPLAFAAWFIGWIFARMMMVLAYLIVGALWLWHRIVGEIKKEGRRTRPR